MQFWKQIKNLNTNLPCCGPNCPKLWTNQGTQVVDDPQNHRKQSQRSLPGKYFFHHHPRTLAAPYGKEHCVNGNLRAYAIVTHLTELESKTCKCTLN